MDRKIQFMGHLPEFYQGVREFEAIGDTEDVEFKLLAEANQEDLLNAFVMTGNENSISIWEKEIGIRAEIGETLDFRRKRLINRYTIKPPFTMRWLEKQLTELLGAGFLKAERDDDVEILYVFVDIDSLPVLREFDATIEMVLPLSMQYFKTIIGHRDIPSGLHIGATSPVHIHIEMR